MRANMTVDPRLIQLLGSKLYTMPPLPICLRELEQNARDACLRKGVTPEITITVEEVNGETMVTCIDNGIGMTQEQILNDFLCLGNKHDDGAKTVGGFGVAKAAIMRNARWLVHSLDNELDNEILMSGDEIRKTDMLEGTTIKLWITDHIDYSSKSLALAMIMFSEIDITLNWYGQVIEHAGFHPAKPPAKMDGDDNDNEFTIYGTNENRITTAMRNFEYTGISVIRLSGLVQFLWDSYNSRETLLIVDIVPSTTPDNAKYSFNMSREKLRTDLSTRIWSFIMECDTNIQSAKNTVQEIQEPPDQRIKTGTLIHGRRNSAYGTSASAGACHFSLPNTEAPTSYGAGVAMFFKGYHPAGRDVAKDARFLNAWHQILEICASDREEFGIGFLEPDSKSASRLVRSGIIYYMIDPEFIDDISTAVGKSLVLYDVAVHEVTHFVISSHTERFTSEMMEIKRETVLNFLEIQEKIANLLG